jgi:hypothetical protein
MYPMHDYQKISDQQFDELVENGFIIIKNYIRGEELATLQAAQRRVLKTWEQVKDKPPSDNYQTNTMFVKYPPEDVTMCGLYRHPELIRICKRYLKSDDVHFRVGYMFARYPGNSTTDTGHIDNGNNSLLPMSETAREFGQIGAWIHLEDVGPDQAPLRLVARKHGKDLSKAVPVVVPAGSIAMFSNYTWHAASTYEGKDGQRFVWGFGMGRADHPFEGFVHYSMHGQHPVFKQMIAQCTAEERTLFRFPKPNHYYYTKQTLAALEAQYPGWNARGEYSPVD